MSAAWGIGVVSTAVAARRAGEKLREIDAMPELDREQLADYKKLNQSEGLHRPARGEHHHGAPPPRPHQLPHRHRSSSGSSSRRPRWSSATSPTSPPSPSRSPASSAGSSTPWGSKAAGGTSSARAGADARRRSGLGPYADLYREAEAAKEAIAAQLRSGSSPEAGPVDADLAPTLDQYLGQVRLLAQSANEIDRLVESIPMADLSKDRAALVAKEGAASESLKAEYRKSIEEIDKQEKSFTELKEQSEVVRLRLGSSVNQLKQMRLDIARVQASPAPRAAAGIEALKRRTDELSRYLEDLRAGYAEGEDDPFAELEEAERDAWPRRSKPRGNWKLRILDPP